MVLVGRLLPHGDGRRKRRRTAARRPRARPPPDRGDAGRPPSTVRGWLRAARGNAVPVEHHAYFKHSAMEQVDPPRLVRLPYAGTPLGYAVDAMGAAAAAAHGHEANPWALLVLLGGARLLAPLRLRHSMPATAIRPNLNYPQ